MKKRKQKDDTRNGVEILMHPDFAPSKYFECALARYQGSQEPHPDSGEYSPDTEHGEQAGGVKLTTLPRILPGRELPEAALVNRSGVPYDDLLCIYHSSSRGSKRWKSIARFRPERLGPHECVLARKSLENIDDVLYSALEHHAGRVSDSKAHDVTIESATLEDSIVLIRTGGGEKEMIKFRGLWFGLGPFQKRIQADLPPVVSKGRREGPHQKLCIV